MYSFWLSTAVDPTIDSVLCSFVAWLQIHGVSTHCLFVVQERQHRQPYCAASQCIGDPSAQGVTSTMRSEAQDNAMQNRDDQPVALNAVVLDLG